MVTSTHHHTSQTSSRRGPKYEKLARLLLTLDDVDNVARSHDIDKCDDVTIDLPLYDSIMCRLAAQPKCITDISISGFLHYLVSTDLSATEATWRWLLRRKLFFNENARAFLLCFDFTA